MINNVFIDDVLFNEGDYVIAKLIEDSDDESIEVEGRIHIHKMNEDDSIEIYICQNLCNGMEIPTESFDKNQNYGYKFSWNVKIENGKIKAYDTEEIKLDERYKKHIIYHYFQDLDDIMPEDWVCTEEIPKDL
jgi:hypothetical protein